MTPPILGIWASAFAKSAPDTGSMFPIGEFTTSTTTAEIEFTNIPQTYTHLQLRVTSTNNDTGSGGIGAVRCSGFFNGDTTLANYNNHTITGDGSGVFAVRDADAKWVHVSVRNSMVGPGASITDILDYRNTNKYKTTRALIGFDNNGSGQSRLISGLWMSTSAVTSLRIVPESGSFKANSYFALYGIL